MTIDDLIAILLKIREVNGGDMVVLRSDNSGGYEAIGGYVLEDARDTRTGQPTKAIVLGYVSERNLRADTRRTTP